MILTEKTMAIEHSIKDRIIVALDVGDRRSALHLVESLSGLVGLFKVGLQLYTAEGQSLVREIVSAGERVFLDLKFHDIPNTVAGATKSILGLGVSIFNVHTLGGAEMMKAAAKAASEFSSGASQSENSNSPISTSRPAVLGVTVLTSMGGDDLLSVGIDSNVEDAVVRLAALARDAGLDGVVASPREIKLIRERVAADRFIILTPGIRPAWSEASDQKRIATPASALADGADFIVVGRAITDSPEPRTAAERILEEIASI